MAQRDCSLHLSVVLMCYNKNNFTSLTAPLVHLLLLWRISATGYICVIVKKQRDRNTVTLKKKRENKKKPLFSRAGVGGGGAHIPDFCAHGRRPAMAVCVIITVGMPRHEPRAVEEDPWWELMKSRWWKGYRRITKHRRPSKAEPGVDSNWKEASSRSSGSSAAGFDVWGCQHKILMAAR